MSKAFSCNSSLEKYMCAYNFLILISKVALIAFIVEFFILFLNIGKLLSLAVFLQLHFIELRAENRSYAKN